MQIFLKRTENILQERLYVRSKTSVSKFRNSETTPSVFSKHNGMKLKKKKNARRKVVKSQID